MNVKTILPLALAIVLGLIAAIVAKNALSKNKTPAEQVSGIKIVVAKRDVAPGKVLGPEDLTLQPVAVGATVPTSAYTVATDVFGRVSAISLSQGQPVMETVLAPKGTGGGLQALIPEGFRAVTIEVNEYTGMNGLLQPGCQVDVVSTLHNNSGNKNDNSLARTVVQSAKLLAIGARTNPNPDPANPEVGPIRSVTLLVAPKDAEALELTATLARPRLVLRGGRDGKPFDSSGITMTELVTGSVGTSERDPFTQPVMDTVTTPTTQPVRTTRNGSSDSDGLTRQITIIRAGTESTVTVKLPLEKHGTGQMTDSNPAEQEIPDVAPHSDGN